MDAFPGLLGQVPSATAYTVLAAAIIAESVLLVGAVIPTLALMRRPNPPGFSFRAGDADGGRWLGGTGGALPQVAAWATVGNRVVAPARVARWVSMMSDVDGPCGAELAVGTTGQQGRKCLGTYPHEMNTCESSAHLEWWANPSTCLARLPVRLTPVLGDTAWNAVVSPAFDDDAADSLQLLIDAGPFFTLRFEDDSTTEVEAAHSGDVHCLRLSAAPSPGSGA